MKKISLVLIIVMMMSVVGCGNKGNEPVEINIPEEYTEEFGVIDTEAIIAEASTEKDNEDGSKTLVFTAEKHKEIMDEIEEGMLMFFDMLEEDETIPYLVEIKPNKDYSLVSLYINKDDGYGEDEEDGVTSLVVGMYVSIYRVYNGDDPNLKIDVVDKSTKELVDTTNFPEE